MQRTLATYGILTPEKAKLNSSCGAYISMANFPRFHGPRILRSTKDYSQYEFRIDSKRRRNRLYFSHPWRHLCGAAIL